MIIKLHKGDITQLDSDAIVNAANSSLLGGGGVDGAIHRAAGPQLLEECRKLKGCNTGDAKITEGYKLPATYVIHTVGPIWKGGQFNETELLEQCYTKSMEIANQKKLNSIAFPNISTGIYGFPKEKAAQIAIEAVKLYMMHNSYPQEVIFCVFDNENYQLYSQLLE